MEALYNKLIDDPIYLMILILIAVIIVYRYFRGYFNNIMIELIDTNNDNIPTELEVDNFINKVSLRINNISNTVKKRKNLLLLIDKFIKTDMFKKYLLKIIETNPNKKQK